MSSSTWVVVASSSCPGDTAVAVLGMRHLPSWAHTGHVLVTAPCGAGCGREPGPLGIVQRGHYVLTLSSADCSRLAAARPRAGPGCPAGGLLPGPAYLTVAAGSPRAAPGTVARRSQEGWPAHARAADQAPAAPPDRPGPPAR